jgi:phosphate transport system substrate-binding protein
LRSTKHRRLLAAVAAIAGLSLVAVACGDDDDTDTSNTEAPSGDSTATTTGDGGGGDLSGNIAIDGSSTVTPLITIAAEDFQIENSGVRVTVGTSGTGGGFEKFCAGETDISSASRPIDEEEEVPVCDESGVKYTEIVVANDGIAVATNKDLAVDCMTTEQLKELWNKGSEISKLSEIDPSFPDTELSLYGPGTDSGTFDFFTDVINGEEGVSREDYEASEDDNQLVTGVSGDEGGFGYFGFSYYEAAADQLNLVGVDSGDGNCVKPSAETIQDGSYKPLSRPLFMYPKADAVTRPEVKAFLDFAVENAAMIAEAAKIVPLTEEQVGTAEEELATAESGS